VATPISGTAQKYFLWDVKGKLCSKFGEDQSKTGSVQNWTHNFIRSRRMDGHRMDAKMNLYSVQCCTLHWTDSGFMRPLIS